MERKSKNSLKVVKHRICNSLTYKNVYSAISLSDEQIIPEALVLIKSNVREIDEFTYAEKNLLAHAKP